MNVYVKEYLRAVTKHLHCPRKIKQGIRKQLLENLQFFESEHSDFTYEDLVKNFGSPEEYSREYIASLDSELYEKEIKKSRNVRIFTLIAILALACIIIIHTCYVNKVLHDTTPVYYDETIEEISE